MWAWFVACAPSVDPVLSAELESDRIEARKVLPPAEPDFAPDLILHLSPPLVGRLVKTGLAEIPTIRDERAVMGVGFATELKVDEVTLRDGRGDTFRAAVRLTGFTDVDAGIIGKSRVPLEINTVVGVEIGSETSREQFRATAKPVSVDQFALRFTALSSAYQAMLDNPRFQEPIRARVEAALTERDAVDLATWPRGGLPARGFRVEPEGAGVRVEMLTTAIEPGRIRSSPPAAEGFRVDIATDSVLWLARTEAFVQPPIDLRAEADARLPEALRGYAPAMEFLPIPERLSVDGSSFSLDMKVWRVVEGGPAWWRQYTASGDLGVNAGHVSVSVSGVAPGPTSPNAGSVDPLAAVLQSAALYNFTDPISRSFPARQRTAAGGLTAVAAVQRLWGDAGAIHVEGFLTLL